MKKVSVIVPIYNVEKYLNKCVESIVEQTYKNLEIILVDDGSPDNCPLMCDEWAKKDERIKVIHKKNGGLSDARNAGMEIMTGDYLMFVDSDDYIENDIIESYLSFIENSDLVSGGCICIDEFENINCTKYSCEKNYNVEKLEQLLLVQKSLIVFSILHTAWSKLYNVELIKKYNLKFYDNKIIFSEDLYFNLLYVTYCRNIKTISSCKYYYVARATSITANINRERDNYRINEYNELCYYLKCALKKNEKWKYLEKDFPFLHFLIMRKQIELILYSDNIEILQSQIDSIKRKDFYYSNIRQLCKRRNKYTKYFKCIYKFKYLADLKIMSNPSNERFCKQYKRKRKIFKTASLIALKLKNKFRGK